MIRGSHLKVSDMSPFFVESPPPLAKESAFQVRRKQQAIRVFMQYMEGKTAEEIGRELDPQVSHQRVVQIIQLAIQTLVEKGWVKVG